MLIKIIILAVLIGVRLICINLIDPLIRNEIFMMQMTNASENYILMQTMQFIGKVHFGICIILIVLIGIDIYKNLIRKKENANEEDY